MTAKIFSAVVALILMLAYLLPVAWKLKDPALSLVMLVGFTLMAIDLWQSLRSKGG